MDRSLYPEGVEVRQSDLKNTEDTRIFHILRRQTDSSNTGVVSGLLVTPNGPNVDIAVGYGYSPSGELVEVENGVAGVELANSTAGVKNFVLAVYTETHDNPRPHETSGDSFPTRANRSVRIEVLSESQFNALPIEDTNLDNTSYNRSLVLAVVTAQGSGVNLVTSNIELSSAFGGGVTATVTGSAIPGVAIIRVDENTPAGVGTLSYTYSTGELEWVAPDDTSGVPVNVAIGGVFELSSQPSGNILTVLVSNSLLPLADDSATVAVANIYTQTVPHHTAKDDQHRSFIGSGVPTPTNPHGLTPGDLGLGETNTEFHQEVFHSSGISPDSDPGFLEPIVNTGGIPHSIDFTQAIAGDKLYLGGFYHNTINGPLLQFTDITDDAQILFNTYAVIGTGNSIATLQKRERVRYVDTPPPTISTLAQLKDLSNNCPAGTAQIQYVSASQRIYFKAPGDAGFGPYVDLDYIVNYDPGIIRLWNETREYWIDLFVKEDSDWAIGDVTVDLLVTAMLTAAQLSDRLLLSTTMFSGSGTGFLGNGFGPANSPNDPNDKRVFGLTDGVDMKAGFDSYVDSGEWYGISELGQFIIGTPWKNAQGLKTCLALGSSDPNVIPLRIYPVSSLPSLEVEDAGAVYNYSGSLYVWNGYYWTTTW